MNLHRIAAVLLGVKAALGVWLAAVLFSASQSRARTFLGAAVRRRAGGLAIVILLFVAVTVVALVGLVQGRSWAPVTVYAIEGLAVLLALARIGRRPGAALVSLALSAAIISLVVAGSRRADTAAGGT